MGGNDLIAGAVICWVFLKIERSKPWGINRTVFFVHLLMSAR